MSSSVLAYGDHPDQVAEFYLPSGRAPEALVVFVHGGYWRARYDRSHARPLAAAIAEHGYAVLLPEYRRVGQPGGGWPGTLLDVAAALDELPGRTGLDVPVVLAGHSAGGQLALWTAVRHLLPPDAPGYRAEPVPLAGVLALAPVADLAEGYRQRVGDGAVAEFLGGSPDEWPERYAAADPAGSGAPSVQVTILHGLDDVTVPPGLSSRYAADGRADLRLMPGVEHFAVITPGSEIWPAVILAIDDLARDK